MDIWQIFVLCVFRNGLNIDYDQLMHMAIEDRFVRSLMGLYRVLHPEKNDIQYPYQTIVDNLKLLGEATINKINDVIKKFGHKEVLKKKMKMH
jgi:hypothetical protein